MLNPMESQLPPALAGDAVQNSVQSPDFEPVPRLPSGAVDVMGLARLVGDESRFDYGRYPANERAELVVAVNAWQDGQRKPAPLALAIDNGAQARAERGQIARLAAGHDGGELDRLPQPVDPVALAKMAPSELGRLLAAELGRSAVCRESGILYRYAGGVWSAVADGKMAPMLARIFDEAGCPYGAKKLSGAIDTMKVGLPEMGLPVLGLVGFANGVYDLKAGRFRAHDPDDYLPSHNGIVYVPALEGENLMEHAPAFTRWLNHAAGGSVAKMQAIKAALYMVLANRYDWQLFLEVTGEGGSGKSVMANLCELLVGRENVGSTSMEAMKGAFGLENVWDKRLVLLPDQSQYIGDGALLKAITGGDEVAINRKGKAMFGAKVRAVVLATNNEPMKMTERNGGISRRRVIFAFNNVVAEADRDPMLGEKIAAELPVLIRHLLTTFADPDLAKELLVGQRDGEEALAIKQESDPVIAMCELFEFLAAPDGLKMGGGAAAYDPRSSLYHFYELYLKHIGAERALQLAQLGKAMRQGAKAYGKEYKVRRSDGKTITNVKLKPEADAILPPGQYRLDT